MNTRSFEIGSRIQVQSKRHPNGTLIHTHVRHINGTDYLFVRLTHTSGSVSVLAQPLAFDETASWHKWGA